MKVVVDMLGHVLGGSLLCARASQPLPSTRAVLLAMLSTVNRTVKMLQLFGCLCKIPTPVGFHSDRQEGPLSKHAQGAARCRSHGALSRLN